MGTGRTREVMEAILKNVDTPSLEEAYKTYVGRVLKETAEPAVTSEKEEKVLAEGVKTKVSGVVKSGDNETQINEDKVIVESELKQPAISNAERQRLRVLAGLA